MSKTTDLRKLIVSQLNTTEGKTYYIDAPTDATFPYKTFEFSTVNMGVEHRDDISLIVDVWDNSKTPKKVEEISDKIEDLFDSVNLPQNTILPTFFRDTRFPVVESDKTIQHIQLTFLVENYKMEA